MSAATKRRASREPITAPATTPTLDGFTGGSVGGRTGREERDRKGSEKTKENSRKEKGEVNGKKKMWKKGERNTERWKELDDVNGASLICEVSECWVVSTVNCAFLRVSAEHLPLLTSYPPLRAASVPILTAVSPQHRTHAYPFLCCPSIVRACSGSDTNHRTCPHVRCTHALSENAGSSHAEEEDDGWKSKGWKFDVVE